MTQHAQRKIGEISLVVKDYDEAIEFYTTKLPFTLVEDIDVGDGQRWVVVSPKDANGGANIVFGKAKGEQQLAAVGQQTGGRVFLFLHTDDFYRDHQVMLDNGVSFLESPREEPYGVVAVFEDLYGNKWDLIQRY